MPNLPHILIPRAEFEPPRRKTGFGRLPLRNYAQHGPALRRQLEDTIQRFQASPHPEGINPDLIFRVQLHHTAVVEEETWERCDLTLLSIDQDKTLVLFSSDQQLAEFRRRLQAYQEGPRDADQKNSQFAGIFASIDQIARVRDEDRIGRSLRQRGILTPNDIQTGEVFVVDIELWDFGTRGANQERVNQVENFVRMRGGAATDRYIGESLVLIRVRANGELVRELLGISAVAEISLPPQPSLRVAELLTRGLPEFPAVPEPNQNAAAIAILDSGLTAAHPLLAPAVGEATSVPRSLGDGSDDHGHGTLVAGLALYGDVASCIEHGAFVPQLRIFSVRVLNERCKFDDAVLITTQMRESIQYLAATYACRVFSLSLGDDNFPYRGGKVSPWAAILDTLARELNVVIVVSAGNFTYQPRPEEFADAHVNRFPRYLLEDEAKIIEPATAAIVLTVGALADSANLPPGRPVELRPISSEHEPSPFTRSGPGLGGAIKPELCEIGGNKAYDGTLREIRSLNELSVVSMNREYLHRLFGTDVGTSLAAPRVAHLAARLLEGFPNASANLIRALLVSSAAVPGPAGNCLDALGGPEAVRRVCGFGRPNLDLARFSDEDRAVLLSESELRHDNFHVYEIPIPDDFLTSRDARSIEVTLAFDPPVRHSRFDYLGVKMSFRLIRGRNLEEVIQTCQTQAGNEDPLDSFASTRWDCKMKPGPDAREGGTLQKAIFSMTRPPLEYGNIYHLVVRCEKKWARIEHEPQRYAIVVTLQQQGAVNIYQQVNQRIRTAVRARVR
jgi:Subtilase family